MSHDIRTPMNAIVGMTTLALANLDNTDKLKDYLYKISVSSQHLLSLINDILDMSQIEQSKIHLNLQTIHIEELIGNISSIMTSQAENIGLCFKIETSVFQHIKFTGDALRIKQILINLLSNAFKFTLEGGMVIFRVEEINAYATASQFRIPESASVMNSSTDCSNHLTGAKRSPRWKGPAWD